MNKKKGVMTSWYIIGIVLAIAVLAIFSILYFVYGTEFREKLSETECTASKELYCGLWRTRGDKPEGKTFSQYSKSKCDYLDWVKGKTDNEICNIE